MSAGGMPADVGAAGGPGQHSTVQRALSVSVVIPTVGRPSLHAAVTSVLRQSAGVGEIIVAADTSGPLELPDDPRIRIIRTGPGAGGNVARQEGIQSAAGTIIALLDDDDEWLPHKINTQLRLVDALRPDSTQWIVGCRVIAVHHHGGREVWPQRLIGPNEDLAEYLFVRHSLRHGHGFLQASGMIFPRALALAVPFRPELRFHQDVTWLVDVTDKMPDTTIVQTPEPLVLYTVVAGSVSTRIRSRQSVDWALRNLAGRSPKALGDFLLTLPVYYARREGSVSSGLAAVLAGVRKGRPSWRAIIYAAVSLAVLAARLPLAAGRPPVPPRLDPSSAGAPRQPAALAPIPRQVSRRTEMREQA